MSGGGENLALTEAQLAECRPVRSGKGVRAFCPFHRSDKQRSLRVSENGRFKCYACGAWGYMEEARRRQAETWRAAKAGIDGMRGPASRPAASPFARPASSPPEPPKPVRADLAELLARYEAALPGGPGEAYLARRRIPLELARSLRAGYATADTWVGRKCPCPHGRLVLPHTAPDGTILNLYGRAVEIDEPAPKQWRHDHLPGNKGYFNAAALRSHRAWVCEGPFDALALLAAGVRAASAIFGVDGWRWEWAKGVREIVFGFDNDDGGSKWREIARGARLRGIAVEVLAAEAYGGQKDIAAAWEAGVHGLDDAVERDAIRGEGAPEGPA